MKRTRFIVFVLFTMLMAATLLLSVNAASDPQETLEAVTAGKQALMHPTFVSGGAGFGEEDGGEWSSNIVDYDNTDAKYCTDQLPYEAIWFYIKPYAANRIILRTANDNEEYPRRMADGWTLSGSSDGKAWTTIYTGKADDVENLNFMYFYVDFENTTEYQYYRLYAEEYVADQEGAIIQLSMVVLAVDEGVEVTAQAPAKPWVDPDIVIRSNRAVTIKATDFDAKTYGKAAADGSKDLRPDEDVNTEFGESEFGSNIGWIAAGDWVQYTVNVQNDGKYTFEGWVASDADPTGAIKVSVGDKEVGTSADCEKNGWQVYALYPVGGEVELTAGEQIIKVEFTGGVNFAALVVTPVQEAEPETEAPPVEEEVAEGEDAPSGEEGEAEPTTVAEAKDDGESNNMMIFIIIGAVLLVVIIVIIVVATKKKKE